MGRDTVQLETAVSTISQEYLLEFTSEYGISEALHPELPGPEDRIVYFLDGKARPRVDVFQQEAWEKYPAMLQQALRFSKKLEQPLLLGGRESVPNYCRLTYSPPADRHCQSGDKNGGPGRSHRLIGVPSTIERSPLDFVNENPSQQSTGPEDQETAALEEPPENVPTMGGAPEADPAERVAATDPTAVKERRKRGHDGVDINAPLKGLAATGDLESENTSFASMVTSPESIYRPEWGITNGSVLDTPEACQDLVDYVAMGLQLRLRFEQEAKLLKKFVAQVARREKRIQARENKIKNLETLLEAEADMKKAAEDKCAKLSQDLENIRALFSDLQVSNNRLSQQVSTLQEQVSREEKLKAAFEEFNQYEDNRVEQRYAEMDVRLDALSIDFDEELYPHMLTAIAGRRWMIRRGLHLAVMKRGESIELRKSFADVVSAGIAKGLSDGLKHGVEHGQAKLDLEALEAYGLEAEAKYLAALHALKNLNSSQLTIPVYPEVRDPMDPWACKEEILLADAIAANVSRVEKKKKCRVVCRTHGVGFAYHARSDGILVSVPTVAPQGLAILLADAATQTETSDEASPQLLRSSSLPVIHS
uniref:Transposase (Putative), gypsy type n=1 Tax=Tanacetum cinerariifolium TaxID=118510 RepID=A0A6L2J8J7_TANCI|nr:hypothetical protein [Tanacetum cinerariifolium]